jgi:hypothetical protein
MSYILSAGVLLVIGVILWAAAETWIEMRRYKRETRGADARLAAAIASSTLNDAPGPGIGEQPRGVSKRVIWSSSSVPEVGRQTIIRVGS